MLLLRLFGFYYHETWCVFPNDRMQPVAGISFEIEEILGEQTNDLVRSSFEV